MIKAPFQGEIGGGALVPFSSTTDRFGLMPGFAFDAMAPTYGMNPQLDAMQTVVSNQMNDVMRHLATNTTPMMAVDVRESETSYAIDANLPGFKRSNISVEVSPAPSGGHYLTISAHRVARELSDDPARRWHRRERVESNISRTLALPANLDLARITSRLDIGVLHIAMPKLPASQFEGGVRKITIS